MSLILNDEFFLRVSKGEVPGYSIVKKFGQNSNLNTSTYEDIWDGGGSYSYPLDGTEPITHIKSSDAGDNVDVEIQGYDATGVKVTQTATLNGLSLVEMATPLWRVRRIKNMELSTNPLGQTINGDVSVVNSADSITYATMQKDNNQTLMALDTIPLNHTGYMIKVSPSIAGTSRAYAVAGKLMMRPYGGVFQLKSTIGLQSDGTSAMNFSNVLYSKIPALTDIKFSFISTINGGVVNVSFDILLIEDGF